MPACSSPPSGATTYAYDLNGNETSQSGVRAQAYNARDQLSSFTPFGGSATSMVYAGPGQSEHIQAGTTTYVNDRLGIASDTESPAASYIHDENGRVIAQRNTGASSPGRRSYLHTDALGSTRTMTNESGTVVYKRDYDPYGRDVLNGNWPASTRIRFAGGLRDAQNYYRFGERYYDPQIGRWTQRDPLDQPSDLRQANRYQYVGDDPINITDPSGTHYRSDTDQGCYAGNYPGCRLDYAPPRNGRLPFREVGWACGVTGGWSAARALRIGRSLLSGPGAIFCGLYGGVYAAVEASDHYGRQ